jgi:hypothetical protein
MTIEEKKFNGPLANYDDDSYEEAVELTAVSSKEEFVKELDLTKVDVRELLLYFCSRFKETQGYEYNVEWVKETAILKSFKERYGIDSGPMIKLLFDKHQGKINDQVMTLTAFSKGSKWIQDTLYIELQQDRIKEEKRPSSEGLMSTDDFLARFNV